MALAAGTRLGTYEVVSLLGAGGMGEVYRARDTRLNRHVALKVLPESFAADADRLARFIREAHALAALNHPHIASIYGLEESGDTHALVLELAEGETVADRIARGPLPVAEALSLARQIAAALEAAHEHGIVHRDLKPANIIITRDGSVKVLDFGLAKLTEPPAHARGAHDLSQSPTLVSPALATHAGVLLGTAAYMSPEQARGKETDKRADLWAFGCVLYEMLTGRQALGGETVTDAIAAIVSKEPDYSALPDDVPPQVRWLIARCLQKDPRARFRDAADAAALFDASFSNGPLHARGSRSTWRVSAMAAAIAIVILGVAAVWYRRPVTVAPAPVVFDIPVTDAPLTRELAISPEGRRIVYIAASERGGDALWVRSLGEQTPRMIAGTEGRLINFPFWSPDGRSIGFLSDRTLKRVDMNGGAVETILALDSNFGGGTWSKEGSILFASNGHGLRAVSASGDVRDVTQRDQALDETYHDCPSFLPDGRRYIYLAYSESRPDSRAIYVGSLDSTMRIRLMRSDSCPAYAAGFLVFEQDRRLMAQPFEDDDLALRGEAFQIGGGVATYANGEAVVFAVSDAGVLVYRKAAGEGPDRRFVWFDRAGKQGAPAGPATRASSVQLSPDGRRVVFAERGDTGSDDVWTYDLARDVKVRLTVNPAVDHVPIWFPDGSQIAFDSHRSGDATLYERAADGATPERVIIESEPKYANSPRSFSPDGKFLVFGRSIAGQPPWDIWILPYAGDRKPFPYMVSSFDETAAAVSPDGQWLAYTTNESGAYQIVLQSFPDPAGGKFQVSTRGGVSPRWRRDGKELYYVAPDGDLMAVPVTLGQQAQIGDPASLFRTPFRYQPSGAGTSIPYDAAPDGQRFLLSLPTAVPGSQPITAVLNWPTLAKGPQ